MIDAIAIRYNGSMLGVATDNRQYGRVTLPPKPQIAFLRDAGHKTIALQLREGLLTCRESARLTDDVELDEDLARIVLRPEFSAHLMEVER